MKTLLGLQCTKRKFFLKHPWSPLSFSRSNQLPHFGCVLVWLWVALLVHKQTCKQQHDDCCSWFTRNVGVCERPRLLMRNVLCHLAILGEVGVLAQAAKESGEHQTLFEILSSQRDGTNREEKSDSLLELISKISAAGMSNKPSTPSLTALYALVENFIYTNNFSVLTVQAFLLWKSLLPLWLLRNSRAGH